MSLPPSGRLCTCHFPPSFSPIASDWRTGVLHVRSISHIFSISHANFFFDYADEDIYCSRTVGSTLHGVYELSRISLHCILLTLHSPSIADCAIYSVRPRLHIILFFKQDYTQRIANAWISFRIRLTAIECIGFLMSTSETEAANLICHVCQFFSGSFSIRNSSINSRRNVRDLWYIERPLVRPRRNKFFFSVFFFSAVTAKSLTASDYKTDSRVVKYAEGYQVTIQMNITQFTGIRLCSSPRAIQQGENYSRIFEPPKVTFFVFQLPVSVYLVHAEAVQDCEYMIHLSPSGVRQTISSSPMIAHTQYTCFPGRMMSAKFLVR